MDDTNPNNTDTHSADPLVQWLVQQGLGKYADVLRENDVDLEVLHHLSDGDLKELGLSLGHRRKLLAALSEAKTADEVGPRAEESPPQADEALDRRQISVVFCDLVGSTALSQQLDPEEMREVMRSYHDAAAAAIKAQEGHVAKLLGDGVLAYFGWPQAHEAQVERAIRAGLAVIDAVKGLDAAGIQAALTEN